MKITIDGTTRDTSNPWVALTVGVLLVAQFGRDVLSAHQTEPETDSLLAASRLMFSRSTDLSRDNARGMAGVLAVAAAGLNRYADSLPA